MVAEEGQNARAVLQHCKQQGELLVQSYSLLTGHCTEACKVDDFQHLAHHSLHKQFLSHDDYDAEEVNENGGGGDNAIDDSGGIGHNAHEKI